MNTRGDCVKRSEAAIHQNWQAGLGDLPRARSATNAKARFTLRALRPLRDARSGLLLPQDERLTRL